MRSTIPIPRRFALLRWTAHCCLSVCLLGASTAATAAAQAPVPAPQQAPAVPAPPTPPPAPRFIVLLDAAHGGDDPGAHLGTEAEKDFTLALSVRLRSLLAARGFQVVTTRESDIAVDANRRAEIANHVGPQACLSLHASQTGSGVHLFVSSLAPAASTRIPAWKTAQSAWITRSLALAGVVNSALLHADLPVTLGRTALLTVDSMTCPAIAVEVAPPPAKDSSAKGSLEDPAYQAKVADALAAAMLEWKSEGRQP